MLALVAVLAGGAGLALRGGDRGVALQSGQAALVSLLAAARSQAALAGRNAALVLHADPLDAERCLRALAPAVRDSAGAAWERTGAWMTLPGDTAVLPPAAPAGDLTVPGLDWGGLRSSAFAAGPENLGGVPAYVLAFTPRGTVVGGGGNLVLAPAVRTRPGVGFPLRFDQPEAVRGVSVSAYGVATLIHDRSGF